MSKCRVAAGARKTLKGKSSPKTSETGKEISEKVGPI